MKALVVYDSVFGNTEQIARAIGDALGSAPDVVVTRVGDARPDMLTGAALVVDGSPTRAFRPTPATVDWLKGLPEGSLSGVSVAAFDTRISVEDTGSRILGFMVRLFGYAAKPIADRLTKAGGRPVAEPEGFYVADREGPLKEGEAERAAAWARGLVSG